MRGRFCQNSTASFWLTDVQRQVSCKPALQILQNEGTVLATVYGRGHGRQAAETRLSSNFNTKKQGAAGITTAAPYVAGRGAGGMTGCHDDASRPESFLRSQKNFHTVK
jgi:hypothetical protein